MSPQPPTSFALRLLARARDATVLAMAIGAVVLSASYCSGCASTGGLAGVVAVAKPVTEAGCWALRRSVDVCDALLGPEDEPAPTSGGETP